MDEASQIKAYPCDEKGEPQSNIGDEADGAKNPAGVKGKGKRGGNASASRVIHSGHFVKKREKNGDDEKTADPVTYAERGRGRAAGDRRDTGRGKKRRRPETDHGIARHTGVKEQAPPRWDRAYTVQIDSVTEIGAFVRAPADIIRPENEGGPSAKVLLPFAEQKGRPAEGETVSVRFYEDKGGRLTCTMRTPILEIHELGRLRVAALTQIGAFLDNGMPKQVLLPFSEMSVRPEVGDEVLVYIYIDKSGRQSATMRIYHHLSKHSPYHEDDRVTGFVYEINEKLGIFVAVDDRYYGLIPIRETFRKYSYGDELSARVARVREDGKLDLLIRDKLYRTIEEDAGVILYELRRQGGFLPYGDRADASFIEETYAMSKNQFKRALGHLYRQHIVMLDRENDTVTLLEKGKASDLQAAETDNTGRSAK